MGHGRAVLLWNALEVLHDALVSVKRIGFVREAGRRAERAVGGVRLVFRVATEHVVVHGLSLDVHLGPVTSRRRSGRGGRHVAVNDGGAAEVQVTQMSAEDERLHRTHLTLHHADFELGYRALERTHAVVLLEKKKSVESAEDVGAVRKWDAAECGCKEGCEGTRGGVEAHGGGEDG